MKHDFKGMNIFIDQKSRVQNHSVTPYQIDAQAWKVNFIGTQFLIYKIKLIPT